MKYRTEQEEFLSGEFGNEYMERNKDMLCNNIALFSQVLKKTKGVKSIIEFGSNIGLNLKAIKMLLPEAKYSAIEINHKAAEILRTDKIFDGKIDVIEKSILEYEPNEGYEFVLIKGVLIHINPAELDRVYDKLYKSSKRYICISEYYNPTPVTVTYRGNENKLFKRDFVGEFMDKFPDCQLVDYGFVYHRDNNFSQDDITWFLLEKR